MIQEAIITIIVGLAIYYVAPSHLIDPTHPEHDPMVSLIIFGITTLVALVLLLIINAYMHEEGIHAE